MSYREDKSTQFSANETIINCLCMNKQLVIVKSNPHKIKPNETPENRNKSEEIWDLKKKSTGVLFIMSSHVMSHCFPIILIITYLQIFTNRMSYFGLLICYTNLSVNSGF